MLTTVNLHVLFLSPSNEHHIIYFYFPGKERKKAKKKSKDEKIRFDRNNQNPLCVLMSLELIVCQIHRQTVHY